jgi:putative ABC transport system permease protein
MLSSIARDLRFARRSLLRTPAITAGAVLSIALGVAATTAVFGIVDAALFRPLPFHDADRLAVLFITRADPGASPARERWSWPRSRLVREAKSFDRVASFSATVLALTGDEPEPVNGEFISSSYWSTLRVAPFLGRAFVESEEVGASNHATAVVGYDLWRRRFGGDRGFVGRTIAANGVTLTVVGIAPPGFRGLSGRAQLWMPATIAPRATYADYLTTNQNFISVVAHLRPGATFDAARAELAVLGESIQRRAPSEANSPASRYSASLVPLAEARVDPSTRRPLLLLLAAVACLFVLSCANVAGLLLGRAVSRRREIAIRVATGASRARIVAQLVTEAALLAALGGALGILIAVPISTHATLPAAAARGANFYGAIGEFAAPRVDVRVLSFAIALTAMTALACGLVPALRATRVDLVSDLKDGPTNGGGASPRVAARQLIVAGEAALAVVLLFSSGLFVRSWQRTAGVDVGFEHSHLLTFLIHPSDVTYPPPRAAVLIAAVLDRIARVPGVDAASVDGCAPVGAGCATSTLYIAGRPEPRADAAPPVLRHYVGPDHFRTLGVPLLRGRVFDARDRAGGKRVAIINRTAAKRFWPNEDPIGRRVWFGGGSTFDRSDSAAEIVGIVGDVAYQRVDERPFQPDFYTPFAQFTYASRTVLVRSRVSPSALVPELRRAVHDVDSNLALFDVRAMDDLIGDSRARLTYQLRLLAAFSVVAIALAATGIFAVIAHAIGDRRREIGIRVALGATPALVVATVGGSGARPAVVGAALGVAIALLLGRFVAATTYGVRAFEPAVALVVVVTSLIIIALTSYLAARRALSVDAAEALKAEQR